MSDGWHPDPYGRHQHPFHDGVQWTNRGQINAGRICGIVATALLGLGVGIVVQAILVGALASGS